jgi:excinuclease ABC subunit C
MNQYFNKSLNIRTLKLVNNIESFQYIIVISEAEALLLERNLITKHNPKYNVLLKDDRMFPYIKLIVNKELEVKLSRKVENDRGLYFGPFPNGYGARELLNLIIRITKFENGLPIVNRNREF